MEASENIQNRGAENETAKNGSESRGAKTILGDLWALTKKLYNIHHGMDVEVTIKRIKGDIEIKGSNIWILGCSIIIASVGLNINSSAAIIGAMLISPLMAPIVGIGLSIGTYDWETLKLSLKSFAVAVGVSILVSTIYFLLSPIHSATSEIIARVNPTPLDVLIAVFGGTAGIVALTRKDFNNVIPGVAIATALMPPLCTAGFGLAHGDFKMFIGALYLFLLNSVFICMSTIVILRFLRFPKKAEVDPAVEKRAKRYIAYFVVLVIVPSGWMFYNMIKNQKYNTSIELFVKENIKEDKITFGHSFVGDYEVMDQDSISILAVYMTGDPVPKSVEDELNRKLKLAVKKTRLEIKQSTDRQKDFDKLQKDIESLSAETQYVIQTDKLLKDKRKMIDSLEEVLMAIQSDTIPFYNIKSLVHDLYPDLIRLTYANAIETDFEKFQDTIPTFVVMWRKGLSSREVSKNEKQLSIIFKNQLQADTVRVLRY